MSRRTTSASTLWLTWTLCPGRPWARFMWPAMRAMTPAGSPSSSTTMARGFRPTSGGSMPMPCRVSARWPRSSSGTPISRRWTRCSPKRASPTVCCTVRDQGRLMPPLREMQAAFGDALLGGPVEPAMAHIVGDGLTPEARIDIYRHHVFTTLTAALQATFPVVCRLVHERFFGYATDQYIRAHPPTGPCLFEYGSSFPAFLAGFEPCRPLQYLSDVAQLEWALNVATHADEMVPLDLAEISRLPLEDLARLTLRSDLASQSAGRRPQRARSPGLRRRLFGGEAARGQCRIPPARYCDARLPQRVESALLSGRGDGRGFRIGQRVRTPAGTAGAVCRGTCRWLWDVVGGPDGLMPAGVQRNQAISTPRHLVETAIDVLGRA